MNISKTSCIITATLISIIGIPLALHSSSTHSADEQLSQNKKLSVSERNVTENNRTSEDLDSIEIPYAYKRLEELYAQFPNLRRAPFKQPDDRNIIEEMLFQLSYGIIDKVKVDSSFKRQLTGIDPWDAEAIETFLQGQKSALQLILKISTASTDHPKFAYHFYSETQEILHLKKISDLLNLSINHELRSGNLEQAQELLVAHRRLQKSFVGGALVHILVATASDRQVKLALRQTAEAGYKLPDLSTLPPISQPANVSAALRVEFASMISYIEHYRETRNVQMIKDFSGLFLNNETKERKLELYKKLPTLDFNQLEEQFAQNLSFSLTKLDSFIESEDWTQLGTVLAAFSSQHQSIPDRSPFLEYFMIPIGEGLLQNWIFGQRLDHELITLDALNQAKGNDLTITSLSDLVPEYLEKLPIDPFTLEPLLFQPEEQTIETLTRDEMKERYSLKN